MIYEIRTYQIAPGSLADLAILTRGAVTVTLREGAGQTPCAFVQRSIPFGIASRWAARGCL